MLSLRGFKESKNHLEILLQSYQEIPELQRSNYQKLISGHLSRVYNTERPYRLLLSAYNHSAGIGDFVHQLDFTLYYQSQLKANSCLKMQSFCFIKSEQVPMVKMFMQEKNIGKIYYFNADADIPFYVKQAESSDYIIWHSQNHYSHTDSISFSKSFANFAEYIKEHDSILQLSRQISDDQTTSSVFQLVQDKFLQTICEYGIYPDAYISEKNYQYIDTAVSMGLAASEVGIKLNEEIRNNTEKVDKIGKAAFYKEMKSHLTALTKIGAFNENYFATHFIANGYLQEEESFPIFIAFVAVISDKSYIDILTNSAVINFGQLIQFEKIEKDFLKSHGIKTLEIIDNQNKKIVIDLLDKDEKLEDPKLVRLIDTSGISDKQKNALIALSDVTAGSGDSSYSDVISKASCKTTPIGKVPFMHSRPWKNCFFAGMLENLNDIQEIDLTLLKQYISYIMGFFANSVYQYRGPSKGYTIITRIPFIDFIKKNHAALSEQFAYYSNYIASHRNVLTEQNNLINRAFVASLFEKGTEDEIKQLLMMMPTWKMGGTNFVFYAIKHNKQALWKLLQKTNQALFLKFLQQHPHPRLFAQRRGTMPLSELTPLELACFKNDIDLIVFFVEWVKQELHLKPPQEKLFTLLFLVLSSPYFQSKAYDCLCDLLGIEAREVKEIIQSEMKKNLKERDFQIFMKNMMGLLDEKISLPKIEKLLQTNKGAFYLQALNYYKEKPHFSWDDSYFFTRLVSGDCPFDFVEAYLNLEKLGLNDEMKKCFFKIPSLGWNSRHKLTKFLQEKNKEYPEQKFDDFLKNMYQVGETYIACSAALGFYQSEEYLVFLFHISYANICKLISNNRLKYFIEIDHYYTRIFNANDYDCYGSWKNRDFFILLTEYCDTEEDASQLVQLYKLHVDAIGRMDKIKDREAYENNLVNTWKATYEKRSLVEMQDFGNKLPSGPDRFTLFRSGGYPPIRLDETPQEVVHNLQQFGSKNKIS